VTSITHNQLSNQLLSTSLDGLIKKWDFWKLDQVLHSRSEDKQLFCSMVLNDKLLLGSDLGFEIYSYDSLEMLEWKTGHKGSVRSITYSHLDKKVFTGGFDTWIFVWKLD